MRVAGSGTASAGAGSGNEGNKAMKDGSWELFTRKAKVGNGKNMRK
jgi:hypothetical protein